MQGDFITDPKVLAVAAVIVVIIIGLVIFLLLRRRSRENEARVRAELVAMERETQFAAAAEQTEYQSSHEEVARQVAALFRDYFSMEVIGIYAGREGDEHLTNVLPQAEPAEGRPEDEAQPERSSLPAALMRQYARPQLTRLSAIFGGASTGSLVTGPLSDEETPPERDGDSASSSALGNEPSAQPHSDHPHSDHPHSSQPHFGAATVVAVLPWQGPFGWAGLIVAQPRGDIGPETLARLSEPLGRFGNRLAVALELERERAQVGELDKRLARTARFARSLVAALDEPTPLPSIARGVAALLQADSAALWRVEEDSSMVKMVAGFGLGSAEFLPLPIGQGLAGSVIQSGEPLAIEDAPSDPHCLFPREARESGIVSYLGVPISTNGRNIAVVEVHTAYPHVWSQRDLEALESAASAIAEMIKSTDVRGNRLKVEGAYLGLSEALQRLRSRDEVMDAVVEVLGHALGVSRAIVLDLIDQGHVKPVKHEYRTSTVESAVGATFSDEVVRRMLDVASKGEPVEVVNSQEDSLMGAEMADKLQVLSELAMPVRIEGRTQAIIYLHQCDRVREWQPDELQFTDRVGRQLSLSVANALALEAARNEAQAAREGVHRAEEARARVQGIVSMLPEAVIGLDPEGRINFFNFTARDWWGLKSEDLGRMADMTEALTASDPSVWDRVNSSQAATRFEAQLTRLLPGWQEKKSGSLVPETAPLAVNIAVAPIHNNRGDITGRIVVISDLSHIERATADASSQIEQLGQKVAELERALGEARRASEESEAALAAAGSSSEAALREERDRLREDEARLRRSAQQLLEINRLKSDFIVNAGRELDSSLQSLLGSAELLDQGSYGQLSDEQQQAVRSIYTAAQRMKNDVEWLVEYGSTRSRRLNSGGEEKQ